MKRTTSKGCDCKEDLVTYIYDEMTPQEALIFKRHLQECVACQEEVNGFASVRETLHSWEMETIPPRLEITVTPSFWQALRNFWRVTPLWGKFALAGIGALALMATLNVNIAIGPQGASFSVGLTRAPQFVASVKEMTPSDAPPTAIPVAASSQSQLNEATVRALVIGLIAESEKRQNAKLAMQVNTLVSDLSERQRTQLVKAVAHLRRDQRQHLAALVQDEDRRDGLDLLDLIGQVQNGGEMEQ